MKAGLATSAVLHAALIGFGLLTLSAPRALEVADVESFPVDIVPVEIITQIQQGDKKAVMKEKSTPVPTSKPDVVPEAKKVGDAAVDTDKPPTPEPKPKPVETAAAPAPAPEPKAKPIDDAKKDPPKPAETKPADAPATEVTPDPQPKQEVKPDPVAETIVAETPDAETIKLPDVAPVPEARPKPPEAQTAKAPDRKETDKPQEKQANKPKSEEKEFNADEVAALLNKEKAVRRRRQALDATRRRSAATRPTTGEQAHAKRKGCAARAARAAAGTFRSGAVDSEASAGLDQVQARPQRQARRRARDRGDSPAATGSSTRSARARRA